MKNHYFLKLLLLLFMFSICFSCDFLHAVNTLKVITSNLNPCRNGHVPPTHKFGSFQLNVKGGKSSLRIGDTIFVNLKINQYLYDSLSKQNVKVNNKVALWVNLTSVSNRASSGNVFAIDTTIYNVFDQYFTTRVLKGKRNTPYRFDSILTNGHWELEIQYIALKKAGYILYSRFDKIEIGGEPLPEGVCMLGDDVFNAKITLNTTNNQISRVYPTKSMSSQDFFGFVVE